MRKQILIFLLLVVLALSACQSPTATDSAAPVETATAAQPPEPASDPADTDEAAASEEAGGSSETADTSGDSSVVRAKCTLASFDPTPGPTEESIFPPVAEADWVRGPDSASVTIIEYSDFQ